MKVKSELVLTGIVASLFASGTLEAASPNRPAYSGVRLGQSQDEVKYLLGYPPNVVEDWVTDAQFPGYRVYQTDGRNAKNAMPRGKGIGDYRKWSYVKGGGRIDLEFTRGGRSLTSIACYSICPPLYGVHSGQSEASVIETLGSPKRISLDGVAKVLSYPDFGLTLTLAKGRVYMMTLHN